MRKLIIPAALCGILFATTAEAGPIRNLLGRLKGKPKAAAGKVVGVVKHVGGCVGGRCSK